MPDIGDLPEGPVGETFCPRCSYELSFIRVGTFDSGREMKGCTRCGWPDEDTRVDDFRGNFYGRSYGRRG